MDNVRKCSVERPLLRSMLPRIAQQVLPFRSLTLVPTIRLLRVETGMPATGIRHASPACLLSVNSHTGNFSKSVVLICGNVFMSFPLFPGPFSHSRVPKLRSVFLIEGLCITFELVEIGCLLGW